MVLLSDCHVNGMEWKIANNAVRYEPLSLKGLMTSVTLALALSAFILEQLYESRWQHTNHMQHVFT